MRTSWTPDAAALLVTVLLTGCATPRQQVVEPHTARAAFERAAENGRMAAEGVERSHRLMLDWLDHSDRRTGLLPRNLMDDRDYWNAKDAAADLYPFLVLTAYFTAPELFETGMHEILLTESALTSRVGRLPDTYSFSKQDFREEKVNLEDVLFGASEYVKDGLMPLTEWLGSSPWSARMIGLLDDIWHYASEKTAYGTIPSRNPEVNGEMLQVLSRVYWMTGEERYLDYAIRLGDYYLLGEHHPTRDAESLRLRDHGNEIVSGLTELYATLHHIRPEKSAAYRSPLHTMLDRILEVGRNEDGLFFNVINPQTGEVLNPGIADNFGYILNGFYTVYLIDEKEEYRTAVRKALGTLDGRYDYFDWETGSADGDADAIEGALNLYNRETVPSAAAWIDRQTRFMWSKQDSAHRSGTEAWRGNGIVEGWYGDGNFSRTSLMVALWKTKGAHVRPWRPGVTLGAVREGDRLFVHVSAAEEWTGSLYFDAPRHRSQLGLPLDWARINQFPEWFTVEPDERYELADAGDDTRSVVSGAALLLGLPLHLGPGEERRLIVRAAAAGSAPRSRR